MQTATKPQSSKLRAESIRSILSQNSEYTKPVFSAIYKSAGIINGQGRYIIATNRPGEPDYKPTDEDERDKVLRNLSLVDKMLHAETTHDVEFSETMDDEDGNNVSVMSHNASGFKCYVVSQFLRNCEKHGCVVAWKYVPDEHLPRIIGFNSIERPVAVLSCKEY